MFDACIDLDIGLDEAEFCRANMVTARKEHLCCECREPILRGQTYELATGRWDESFLTFRTCLTCKRIRDQLFDGVFEIGGVWDAIHEAYCGDQPDECICPPGLRSSISNLQSSVP